MRKKQLVFWIGRNLQPILFFCGILILIGFGFIGWNEWNKKEEQKNRDVLYEKQKALKQLVNKMESSQKDLMSAPGVKEKAGEYEQAIRQKPKRMSSAVSAIDLADFYYKYGEVKKAKDLLVLFARPEKSSNIYHLVTFQLARYHMDARECKEALTLLEELSLNPKAGYFHLESNLQQALCLENMGRYELALQKYDSVLNKDPEGYTGHLAQDYKKLLIIKRNIKTQKDVETKRSK